MSQKSQKTKFSEPVESKKTGKCLPLHKGQPTCTEDFFENLEKPGKMTFQTCKKPVLGPCKGCGHPVICLYILAVFTMRKVFTFFSTMQCVNMLVVNQQVLCNVYFTNFYKLGKCCGLSYWGNLYKNYIYREKYI